MIKLIKNIWLVWNLLFYIAHKHLFLLIKYIYKNNCKGNWEILRQGGLKKNIFIILICICVSLLIPAVFTLSVTGVIEENMSDSVINGRKINVKYKRAVKSVDINKFIIMVLAQRFEMSQNIEVLKAESIMVRTDIYRIMKDDMQIDSENLNIPFLTENQMKDIWKDKFSENYNLIADCVSATSGVIMTYNGSPIEARYTNISSGATLSGVDVLGNGYEYLKSVSCPDDMQSPDYINVLSFTYKDFVKKLTAKYKDIGLDENAPFKSIQIVAKTTDGYIKNMQVGNVVMTGAEFAQILGINSANMTLEDINGSIKITTKGEGSNFGVSMYTASIMAETGNTYEAILTKFYSGITFVSD